MNTNSPQTEGKKEIVLKHLAKYYNRKGRTINNDDILPMSRILPMMDEYAQAYHKSLSLDEPVWQHDTTGAIMSNRDYLTLNTIDRRFFQIYKSPIPQPDQS